VAYTGPAPVANPTGAILMWGGPIANQNEAPSGYKWCNGDDLNTFDFKDLHAVISNTYGGTAYTAGVTDQSGATTTFKLPNMLGNVAVGAQSLQNYNLGDTGGQTEHTISAQQIPKHRHNSGTFETRPHYHHTVAMTETSTTMNDTTAPHTAFRRTSSYTLGAVSTTPSDGKTGIPKSDTSGHVNSIGEIDVIGKTGESIFTTTSDSSEVETQQAIPLTQPYIALNYIIKT
jgi:microcystin-dependent protein